MHFEWDEQKNEANVKKHGISFSSSEEIFSAPYLQKQDLRKSYGEERWILLRTLRLYCVIAVYTKRENTVRMISIRRASREETKTYRNRFQEIGKP